MPSPDNPGYADYERAVVALAAVICPEAWPMDGWPAMATVSCQRCRDRAADIIETSRV